MSYSITSSARARSVGGIVRPEHFGSFQVQDQFELGRLLNGQIAGLRALQDAVDVVGRATPHAVEIGPIARSARPGLMREPERKQRVGGGGGGPAARRRGNPVAFYVGKGA